METVHEFAKPPGERTAAALAEIRMDGRFRIVSTNQDYYSIYEVPVGFTPRHLVEVVEERASRGWYGLAEILGEGPASKIRLAEIKARPSNATIEISSRGEILSSAHTSSADGSRVRLVSALTGYSINRSGETEGGWQGLLILREILALGQVARSLLCGLSEIAFAPQGFSFLADSAGRLIMQTDHDGAPPHLIDAKFMDDLNIPYEIVRRRLIEDDCCVLHVFDPARGLSRFKARKYTFFPGGPHFLVCRLSPLAVTILPQAVQSVYRDFSGQEAAAIAALAEGRTIKQAAGFLQKSPVTVALQARSALNKTPHSTLEQLLPIVVLSCADAECG